MIYKDQLWEQQEKLIGDIEFILQAFQEESPIYNNVTDKFPTIEDFIGDSVLSTSDGNAGYIMHGDNDELIFAQFFSDNKKIHTYVKDRIIVKQQFLVIDPEMEGPLNKLETLVKRVNDLKAIQKELDELEKEQIDE